MRLNNFKKKLKGLNKAERTNTSAFKLSSIVRKRIVFSGRVQGVGFRYETYILAGQLNLTGWVKNKNRDKVELEVQGEENDISFLVSYMKSLKRAAVTHVEINEIPLVNDERDFTVRHG